MPRTCRTFFVLLAHLTALLGVSAVFAADRPEPAPASGEQREAEARILVRRGLAAYARGEHATALTDYEHASALVPDANLPWLYRAEALRALGRSDESIAAYERYLSIDPSVSDAAAVRAKIEQVRAGRRAQITLETRPPGARVRDLDLGTVLGTTPVSLTLLPGRRRLQFERDRPSAPYQSRRILRSRCAPRIRRIWCIAISSRPTYFSNRRPEVSAPRSSTSASSSR